MKNLIHVKINEDEALEARRNLLTSEENLLETIKSVKKYFVLRNEELRLKIKFQKNIKEFGSSIKKIENSFPEMNDSPVLKKTRKVAEKQTIQDKSLETELNEIRDKLRAMSNR
ncbi:MAG: hypothetical protein Q7S06_03005 [Nanoarchaeota archaeon]|nr:hypothetical protein [Nanoarchaeota archaeon]